MEELYAEGLATHGDPESCVDDPRGRGEALTGARAGRAMEPRNQAIRGAHAVSLAEGNTLDGVMRESRESPARSETQGMCGNSMRETGDPVPARLADHRAGRSGNAEAVILRRTGPGSRIAPVVPANPPDKAAAAGGRGRKGSEPRGTRPVKHAPDAVPGQACQASWAVCGK